VQRIFEETGALYQA